MKKCNIDSVVNNSTSMFTNNDSCVGMDNSNDSSLEYNQQIPMVRLQYKATKGSSNRYYSGNLINVQLTKDNRDHHRQLKCVC